MELIYEDLTRELIGCFFDVHNSLGVGYDEPAYHKALQRRFDKKGIEHRSEERKALLHRALKVREFKADLITFNKIILELKSLQSGFIKPNYVQIISELKLWQMQLGLLVNFGLQKVEIERIPFTEKEKVIHENYDGEFISVFKMKPLLIENRMICDIKTLHEKIDFYDIAKIQSYLRALGLKIGIVANFGKNDLEIRGIRV